MLTGIFSDKTRFIKLLETMSAGIWPTCRIFLLTLAIAVPLGMLLAAGRVSKFKPLNWLVSLYVYIMRSTPLMLQLLFSYFLLSQLKWNPTLTFFFGDKRSAMPNSCIIYMFSLNYAAYFAEIFRGGIQAISVGQKEAAKVLGYRPIQAFFRIQVPQIFKTVMPSLTNEFVTLVKDTSIAKVISTSIEDRTVLEIASKQATSLATIEPYILVFVFFLLFNGIVEQGCKFIERRLNYYR